MSQQAHPLDVESGPFVDLSLDALCVAGFDGYLLSANPAFAKSLGYREAEVVSRPFTDTVHPEDVETVRARFAELASSNELSGFECRHMHAEGSVLSMKLEVEPTARRTVDLSRRPRPHRESVRQRSTDLIETGRDPRREGCISG